MLFLEDFRFEIKELIPRINHVAGTTFEILGQEAGSGWEREECDRL